MNLNNITFSISDFDNEWNKKALKLAQESRRDEMIEMSQMPFSKIDHEHISFWGAYESRKLGITAGSRQEYVTKERLIKIMKPVYYLLHNFHRTIS